MIKALMVKRELNMRRDGTATVPPDAPSTVVLHNYRIYGSNLDTSTIMMAYIDSIIGDAKCIGEFKAIRSPPPR